MIDIIAASNASQSPQITDVLYVKPAYTGEQCLCRLERKQSGNCERHSGYHCWVVFKLIYCDVGTVDVKEQRLDALQQL